MLKQLFAFKNVILVLGMILLSTSTTQALPEQELPLRQSREDFFRRQGSVSLEKEKTSVIGDDWN